MIELKDVSTYNLLYAIWTSKTRNKEILFKCLIDYNISDYQKLEDFIMNHPVENINYDYLELVLKKVKFTINMANEEGRNKNVYKFPNYEDELLESTDENVYGHQLILVNPIQGYNSSRFLLTEMNIKRIKYLLSHTTPNGENALRYINRIGNAYVMKVLNAVKFYDEQVKRQLEYYQYGVTNLFELNQDEKTDELILGSEPIQYSLDYIVDTAIETIWGPMTDYQKKKIKDMSRKIKNGNFSDKGFNSIFNIIRDYVTLEECQKGLVKTKAIKRFIIK